MTEFRSLSVKSLTRVEGEGALRLRVADGRVEIAEFNIYEPPRFFERLLRGRAVHEVPDITARICGICPVAYQLTAAGALEAALGVAVTPAIDALRRLLYCGEWIQSHALHLHLLHAPDFLGYESGFTMAVDHPELVERGMRMKGIGARIMEVVGGRAVHPINIAVGGFHRAPAAAAVRALVPDLEWGLGAAAAVVREVARFDVPDFTVEHELVSLRADSGYPITGGRIVSSRGLDIDVAAYPDHFAERQVPHSTALYSGILPDHRPYLTGALARLSLNADRLPEPARRALDASGLELPVTNSFRSIVARAVELVAAFATALEIARGAAAEITPCRLPFTPRAGAGSHATEAPRGLLFHRYVIGDDGLVAAATIVPPTAQNQAAIEAELRGILPKALALDDAAATLECERVIRNHDPCISCATHFLRLSVERHGLAGPHDVAGQTPPGAHDGRPS